MSKKKQKILIIKVGYSETLDSEISNVTSYGDVLRSTVLLNLYKSDHVTWLVDEKAFPILKDNPIIDRVFIYNLTSVLQLQAEHFDTVINLEKVPGLCALADQITSWRRYGFRFDVKTGEVDAYDGTQNALFLCKSDDEKKNNNRYWQEHLYEMVGSIWKGEEYVFGYKSDNKEKYDIGFNYHIGNKWPLKAWPLEYWKTLESFLCDKYTIAWQQGLDQMEEYFKWINSCRLIITNDSFGLHLAIALKKKLICLFGPTHHLEHYFYNLGSALHPKDFVCKEFPCHVDKCLHFKDTCMSLIKPESVVRRVDKLLK